MGSRVAFLVDVTLSTFEQLDVLLGAVMEWVDGRTDWPPTQDKECMAVSTLNLLNLQVSGFFLRLASHETVVSRFFFW